MEALQSSSLEFGAKQDERSAPSLSGHPDSLSPSPANRLGFKMVSLS